jgi:hypothetical protein
VTQQKEKPEYVRPKKIKDYGDLRELTATNPPGLCSDVPFGRPINVSATCLP